MDYGDAVLHHIAAPIHPQMLTEVVMTTIVGTEGRAGNDYLVPIAVALVATLVLKAGMIAIFSAAGLLFL
jgi:hypothetical protein